MRNILILILFLAVIIAGCGYKDVEINGTVVNKTNSVGILGVKIESGNQKTTSGAGGKFLMEGEIVENGTTVELFFSHTAYSNYSQTVPIPSGEASTLKPENENIIFPMGKK